MNRLTVVTRSASILIALWTTTGCWSSAAVNDLKALRSKTCGCEASDRACLEEATRMAYAWKGKHAGSRGGDQETTEALVADVLECNVGVAFALVLPK